MPIWELNPIDPEDPIWRSSKYCGRVVVRAKDESAARRLAFDAFGPKWAPLVGAVGLYSPLGIVPIEQDPWEPARTLCNRLEGSGFEEEGPEKLFEPAPAKKAPPMGLRPRSS